MHPTTTALQTAAMNPPYLINIVVTAGVDEEKVPGIAADEVEEATGVVQLVRKQVRVSQA